MNYNDKVITMDNGEKYIVIEQVDYNGKTYLYLINKEDNKDAIFVEIKNDNILKIDPKLFSQHILPLFLEKLSKFNNI